MKTSVLISGIAALYLLIAFAEAPRRHYEDNMNISSSENISFVTINMVHMLPGVTITAERNDVTDITALEPAAEDFSYLKFEVTDYLETDAVNTEEDYSLPESTEADYAYLKFELSDYLSASELPGSEITELPEKENSLVENSSFDAFLIGFAYLRFDVNDYINNEDADIMELPESETESEKQAYASNSSEPANDFSYLKFNVANFYNPDEMSSGTELELPEK
jgi:hypothetical protein